MRLWSIHPRYLDRMGLIAAWREGLLAKKVLEGKTKGYKDHPQLLRFKEHENPICAINAYLLEIYKEAKIRGYNFDENKIRDAKYDKLQNRIPITSGQIRFEFMHLLNKLKSRDKEKYLEIKSTKEIEANPIFVIVEGKVASWEKSYKPYKSYKTCKKHVKLKNIIRVKNRVLE